MSVDYVFGFFFYYSLASTTFKVMDKAFPHYHDVVVVSSSVDIGLIG